MTTNPTSRRRARPLWRALVVAAGLLVMACGSEAGGSPVATAPATPTVPADAAAPAAPPAATPVETPAAPPAPAGTEAAGESTAPAAPDNGAGVAPTGRAGEGAEGGEADTSPALGDPDDGSPPEMPTPEPYGPDDGVSGDSSSSSSEDATDGAPPAPSAETGAAPPATPPAEGDGSPNDAVAAGADDATAVSPENPVAADNRAAPAAPPPPPPPVDVRPRGHIRIDDVQFLVREKFPMSVAALVSGALPTPCHEVAWEVTSQGSRYEVTVWSVESAEEMACIQVEEPFTAQVELGDDFLFEDYTVVVNGTAHALDF